MGLHPLSYAHLGASFLFLTSQQLKETWTDNIISILQLRKLTFLTGSLICQSQRAVARPAFLAAPWASSLFPTSGHPAAGWGLRTGLRTEDSSSHHLILYVALSHLHNTVRKKVCVSLGRRDLEEVTGKKSKSWLQKNYPKNINHGDEHFKSLTIQDPLA